MSIFVCIILLVLLIAGERTASGMIKKEVVLERYIFVLNVAFKNKVSSK